MSQRQNTAPAETAPQVNPTPDQPGAASARRQIIVTGIFTIAVLGVLGNYLFATGTGSDTITYAMYAAVVVMFLGIAGYMAYVGIGRIGYMLAVRSDTEHEQIIIRVLLVCAMLSFYIVILWGGHLSDQRIEVIANIFDYAAPAAFAIAFAAVILLIADPAPRIWRRYAANVVDQGGVSILMYLGGELSAPLFVSYLWVTFGCGFRFGLRPMLVSAVLSVVGFLSVILTTHYWQMNQFLGYGLLCCLVMLPSYGAMLVRSLTIAKESAEQASQAKSRFLATISHELRTPLNAIIGVATLVKRGGMNAEQRFLNQSILSSARTLLALINNILDFSKFESEKIVAKPAPFDLHRLLAEVEAMFAVQAREKGLRFSLFVAPDVPPNLFGDPDHLRGVFVNLVGNGLKFTERGSVRLRVTAEDHGSNGIILKVTVSDTGIGIPRDKWETIFESFRQGDETITRRYGGTGLGLTIVRQLVDAMGGDIDVTSEVSQGSVFKVNLPLGLAPTPTVHEAPLTEHPVVLMSRNLAVAQAVRPVVSALGGRMRLVSSPADLISQMDVFAQSSYRPVLILDIAEIEELPEWSANARGSGPQPVLVGLRPDTMAEKDVPPDFTTVVPVSADAGQIENALRMASRLSGLEVEDDPSAVLPPADYVRPLEILVAEDNQVNRKVLAMMLKQAGHKATMAADGEEALDILEDKKFDLVLMDLNMPNMSGTEATQMFRYMELGRERTPVVALTADSTAEGRQRASDAQMDGYLVKPVEADELNRALRTYVPVNSVSEATMPAPAAAAGGGETNMGHKSANMTGAGSPVVDPNAIEALKQLGDATFFNELVEDFLAESSETVRRICTAVEACDPAAVRDGAHALRSSASHFGAHRLHDTCLTAQGVGVAELSKQGAAFAESLQQDYRLVAEELKQYAENLRQTA